MTQIRTLTCGLLALFLSACATTPEAKLKQAYKRAQKSRFDELPSLYVQLEKEGKITPETRKDWTDAWAVQNKERQAKALAYQKEQKRLEEQRRRWLASLTPAQRMDLEMRERELQQRERAIAWQAEQQRQERVRAAWQNVSDSFQQASENIQRQQELNAYNQRTRALSQPQTLNINGNINHNVNGTIYHRYPTYGY